MASRLLSAFGAHASPAHRPPWKLLIAGPSPRSEVLIQWPAISSREGTPGSGTDASLAWPVKSVLRNAGAAAGCLWPSPSILAQNKIVERKHTIGCETAHSGVRVVIAGVTQFGLEGVSSTPVTYVARATQTTTKNDFWSNWRAHLRLSYKHQQHLRSAGCQKHQQPSHIPMLLVLVCLLGLGAAASPPPALNDAIIASVNRNPDSTWAAARNSRFEHLTLEEASMLLGSLTADDDDLNASSWKQTEPAAGLGKSPTNFDSRDHWPSCIGQIRNQGHCGACWAFASSETLSDRFCIASNGSVNVTLAPQDLISCGHIRTPPKYMLGCDGGVPEYAWKYLETTGISSDDCMPFAGNVTEKCPTTKPCDAKKYKIQVGSSRLLGGGSSAAAQQYMSGSGFQPPFSGKNSGGPIQAVFYVYQDFFAYKSGVYKRTNTTQKTLGKHSVKLVGYGVDSIAGAYWTAANSWGSKWGMDGYFKIGAGECEIGSELTFGAPLLQ